jgi:ribulose-phosphate 3-epimerase
MLGDDVDIQVDGGIKDSTIGSALDAGANVFVVGSYLFKSDDPAAQVRILKELLGR